MPTPERARERARIKRLIRFAGLVGAVAIIALIAAGMSITYRYWDQAEKRQQLVVHSYEVIDVGRQLLSTLQDAETGQRGYLITGRLNYLAPYDQARLRLDAQLSQLEALVREETTQARRAERLRTLATSKMQELDRSLALFRERGRESATSLIESDSGRTIMDQVRAEMAAFFAEQQSVLNRRLEGLRGDQRRATLVAAATFAGALIALLVSLGLSLRGVRQLGTIERQLAARTQFLQTTLENLPDAIVVLDGDGTVAAWNEVFARLIGWTTNDTRRLVRDDLLSDRFPIARTLLGEVLGRNQAKLQGGTLDRRATLNGRNYEIGLGRMPAGELVITLHDVTDKIRADDVLHHAQKMEAIGQLTGGMAHDFNNILQVIQTNLDLLASDVARDPEAARRVDTAQLSAQRAARLTRQLLAFARRQSLEPVATNVGRLVLDMTDLLRHSLGEPVELTCTVEPGAWNAKVDPGQLENAIINLAVNARDAMPDGGRLTIDVSNVAHGAGAAPGEYVLVSVADSGTGMPPEIVDKAFDPFFTTKEEGKGTGLGLSMVYGFITQSGGDVAIDSAPGHGTTINMYLPRTLDPVAETTTVRPPTLEGNERVLLVEDNDNVRHSLAEMLQGLGYRVTAVNSADTALATLKGGTSFDLLLSDMVMPGKMNAVELAAAARHQLPRIAVLFMSGYAQNAALRHESLPPGATLLSKPFRREDLALRLRAAFAVAPQTAPDAGSGVGAEPAPARPTTHGRDKMRLERRVLLVEDEVLVRMSTSESLRRLGCEVEAAANAEHALELLDRGSFDVMITDIGLPGMSGLDLVGEARRRHPDLRIAIASGYRDAKIEASLPAGTKYLVKPYTVMDLRPLLERA